MAQLSTSNANGIGQRRAIALRNPLLFVIPKVIPIPSVSCILVALPILSFEEELERHSPHRAKERASPSRFALKSLVVHSSMVRSLSVKIAIHVNVYVKEMSMKL